MPSYMGSACCRPVTFRRAIVYTSKKKDKLKSLPPLFWLGTKPPLLCPLSLSLSHSLSLSLYLFLTHSLLSPASLSLSFAFPLSHSSSPTLPLPSLCVCLCVSRLKNRKTKNERKKERRKQDLFSLLSFSLLSSSSFLVAVVSCGCCRGRLFIRACTIKHPFCIVWLILIRG